MSAFTEVFSLGSYCATKFQLSRHAYLQRNPQASLQEVRAALFSSAGIGETHIFDWQVTPFSAVIDYIERDFRGVFDRSDLEIDPQFGVARNRLLGVLHSHAFHASGEKLTDADIDAQYDEARSKIDYLAQKFRWLLERTGPILYVASVIPSADEVRRFIRAMEVSAPGQRYHVAFVGRPSMDPEHDLSEFGPMVSRQFVALPRKPPDTEWEGDDETWEAALRIAVSTGKPERAARATSPVRV
jgi:hypothetical protein